jgi:hypothetical protein
MKRLVWICIVLFAASAAVAQSLAEVAKKEKERRKQLESSESRTITDTELRRAGGPRTLLPASRTSADDDADATEEDAGEDEEPVTDERQTEAYWRGRLEPIDTRIKAYEERLNSPQLTMNPVGAPERARVEQQLADARAERQAVIDEARRKGVPPGWLR